VTSSPPATLLAGRYRLGDVLGRGGMADVYRAEDLVLGRHVAVKWLRQPAGTGPEAARAQAEARMLAALSHPNLVTVFDAGAHDGRPFLVMELVAGSSLADHGRRPRELGAVADLGVQLADALAYVHARRVIHRDLKPANVLLEPGRGGAPVVKLSDFGIARVFDAARLTATGAAIGTPAYLAPEQLSGGPLTGAVDVYALGLVLLECLTGTRPFPGNARETAMARLTRSAAIPAELPAAWAALLSAMTQVDPALRPDSNRTADALRALRAGSVARITLVSDASGSDSASHQGEGIGVVTTVASTVADVRARTGDTTELDLRSGSGAGAPVLRQVAGPARLRGAGRGPHGRGVGLVAGMVVALAVVIGAVLATQKPSSPGPVTPLPAPSVTGQIGHDLSTLHQAVNQ
jgi:serine/threonine protein kinase